MDFNQSVRKATELLREVAQSEGVRAATISRNTGMPWATTVRLLRSLEGDGLIFRDPDSDLYFLGLEFWRLARTADVKAPVEALARPVLVELAAATGETINLTLVRPGDQLDIVVQIDPNHLIRPTNWVGWRVPLHASALGKLLLATYTDEQLEAVTTTGLARLTPATIVTLDALREELAEVRTRGWALASDELEVGLTSLAVASHDPGGRMTFAVSASGPSYRFNAALRKRLRTLVQTAVDRIDGILAPSVRDSAKVRGAA